MAKKQPKSLTELHKELNKLTDEISKRVKQLLKSSAAGTVIEFKGPGGDMIQGDFVKIDPDGVVLVSCPRGSIYIDHCRIVRIGNEGRKKRPRLVI